MDKVQKLTPCNSSLPPSTEHPHAKPKRKPVPGKKRKQGGQKGHKRHLRELIPSEQCTTVIPCQPAGCRRCGDDVPLEPPPPQRNQVWDPPELEPIVDEYQPFRGRCPCCDTTAGA
ncbi:hypothetical protein [Roseimaritima sediminicola]|uniref:hypothetical protein n=1 Tax=Roseimaritima sediminicola TaxID=2662066 RepID=UPI0036F1C9AE